MAYHSIIPPLPPSLEKPWLRACGTSPKLWVPQGECFPFFFYGVPYLLDYFFRNTLEGIYYQLALDWAKNIVVIEVES